MFELRNWEWLFQRGKVRTLPPHELERTGGIPTSVHLLEQIRLE